MIQCNITYLHVSNSNVRIYNITDTYTYSNIRIYMFTYDTYYVITDNMIQCDYRNFIHIIMIYIYIYIYIQANMAYYWVRSKYLTQY